MSQIIKFKENANPAKYNLGLESQGRSKFPGCYDMIQPAKGVDGRWKTGLDEYAHAIATITDSTLREKEFERVKAERESLEMLLNKDLSGTSKFWDDFWIKLDPSIQLDLSIPMDRVIYAVLSVSDAVAPSLKEASNPDYFQAKYYIAREHEDVGDRISKKKRYNEAAALLNDLVKTPEKAVIIGRYLDLKINNNTPFDNLYDAFQTYLDNNDSNGSVERFLSAMERSPEELNIKLIFADAIKYNVIRQREGLFQRGSITLGRSAEDAVKFLSDVKNSGELLSIQEEIEIKRRTG